MMSWLNLRCVLSGASSNEVEYYWWLIAETNSPIYIYSVGIAFPITLDYEVYKLTSYEQDRHKIKNSEAVHHKENSM